jgi:hypothetical protein
VPALEPVEIYERTRAEGKRRLARPLVELAATAVAGNLVGASGSSRSRASPRPSPASRLPRFFAS